MIIDHSAREPDRGTRTSARVVLLDSDGRVLLLRIHDRLDDKPPCWVTPGGAVETDETLRAGAARELWEETGLEVDPPSLGGPVAVARGAWEFRGTPIYSEDWYFVWRTAPFELDPSRWTELEREVCAGWRWWSPDELDALDEVVFPEGLGDLIRSLADAPNAAGPVELPWTTL